MAMPVQLPTMADPPDALLRLLAALLLGGLIGAERERSAAAAGERDFAGVRTFPLFAMLGAAIALVSGGIGSAVIVGFAGITALVIASYFRTSTSDPGTTTEVAALATYWVGVMAGAGALVVAGVMGVGVVALLATKERLEAFSRALTRDELSAVLGLAVISVVILPVLPDAPYGPWGVWNPRRLWLMVVLVCGLSFVAFVAMRLLGGARALYLSGLLGGLVSSTAVTVAFASRSAASSQHATALAVASGLASLVMLVRIAVLCAVVQPRLLFGLGPEVGLALAAGALAVGIMARRTPVAEGAPDAPELTNPFRLTEALKFTAFYAVVLLFVRAAGTYLGTRAIAVAAAVSGLTDVDAITLSLAGSSGYVIPSRIAAGGIAVAMLANTLAKAVYASWLGSPAYRRAIVPMLGVVLIAGVAGLFVWDLLPW
jgi:uncharacterized membrane protein (DUF4010 family)